MTKKHVSRKAQASEVAQLSHQVKEGQEKRRKLRRRLNRLVEEVAEQDSRAQTLRDTAGRSLKAGCGLHLAHDQGPVTSRTG